MRRNKSPSHKQSTEQSRFTFLQKILQNKKNLKRHHWLNRIEIQACQKRFNSPLNLQLEPLNA